MAASVSLLEWVDAAFPPTPAQARAAFAAGYRGCGFYLPGESPITDDPLHQWSPADAAVVAAAGLAPVPIWVPDPSLPGDPAAEATAAVAAARECGLSPTCSILYDGNHLTRTGQVVGPVWLPIPGPAPTAIGAGSAIQWGSSSVDGWDVDVSSAAADFP